jgi:site-specific recombinase XerC
MLFDWLVTGQIVPTNPASAVRGPKHVVKTGKTPVLDGKEWRKLIDAIPTDTVRDLRDRALIATLTYSFARIGAALKMKVEDLGRRAPAGCCGRVCNVPVFHLSENNSLKRCIERNFEMAQQAEKFRSGTDSRIDARADHEQDAQREDNGRLGKSGRSRRQVVAVRPSRAADADRFW